MLSSGQPPYKGLDPNNPLPFILKLLVKADTLFKEL